MAPVLAGVLICAEALASWTLGPSRVLVLALLLLSPGLACHPFLPRALRVGAVGWATLPVVGFAVATITLVSASVLHIPLEPAWIRGIFAVVALAGMGGSLLRPAETARLRRHELGVLGGLGLVLAGAAVLQSRVLWGHPLPGEDWGEYLLYAREVAAGASLQVDNPFWMLGGESFPLDPGLPAVYGAFLVLSGAPVTALLNGIWVVALLAVIGVFVWIGSLWGYRAGLLAAAVYAVIPLNLNMLAWHGAPNVAAFSGMCLALAAAAWGLRSTDEPRRWGVLLGTSLVALAALHRYAFVLSIVAVFGSIAFALWRRPRPTARLTLWACLAAVGLGSAVAIDLVRRNVALGGTQGYEAFLPTRVDWELVFRDTTWPLVAVSAAALTALFVWRPLRGDDGRFVLVSLALAMLALTYAWIVHVPTAYNRAAFFLPLVVAPSVGIVLAAIRRAVALPVAVAVIALTAFRASELAGDYRGFYQHVDEGSLRGLGLVLERTARDEGVVTDQCWGFLSTWLLQRPVLAALDPALILPKREVAPARRARRILYSAEGASLARASRIRFALVDPQCRSQDGQGARLPVNGALVYASTRLLVFRLG